jgi:hypothetical protein
LVEHLRGKQEVASSILAGSSINEVGCTKHNISNNKSSKNFGKLSNKSIIYKCYTNIKNKTICIMDRKDKNMIDKSSFTNLCEKYKIDAKKLIDKNPNILYKGDYQEIDDILDYLINKLAVSSNNIEKCPSILYRNVNAIKSNVDYLKEHNVVSFSNIESCLHVLSTDCNQLKETYDYVLQNYGVKSINKNTSILVVNKNIIEAVERLNIPLKDRSGNLLIADGIELGYTTIEDIKDIIQSQEYKDHPELFTSETLAFATLEDIKDIIQSQEYKDHPELFTSETLARAKLEDIKDIIQSQEYKDHPELFTSETLARAKLEDIKNIIQSQEYKDHPELFTSTTLAFAPLEDIQDIIQSQEYKDHPELFTSETLAFATLEDIKDIIQSQEYKDHPELFTSTTLAHAKLEDIQKLLSLNYWQDDRFKGLLTSSIVAKSKSMIKKLPKLVKLAEEYNISDRLNTSFLLFSQSQNYALIQYLKNSNQPLIVDNKLNPIFGKQPGVLQKKYEINIKDLMKQYPLRENEKGDEELS